jgi:ketosteroid isomerase-like protein
MTDSRVALKFVEKINAHDADGLAALMTADHVFIDSLGERVSRPAIETGWKQYFEMVPDYWVRIDRTLSDKDTSILLGTAGGTYVPSNREMKLENKWETPAVWVAQIRGERVSEWRIYADNEPIREKMRKSSS